MLKESGSGGGTLAFVYPGTFGRTTRAQEAIYRHAVARAGLKGNRSDGTIAENYYVLRKTSMSASLIECGFMDSSTDIEYILDPDWSRKIALGIAEGICEVFGGNVKAEPEEKARVMDARSFDEELTGAYGAAVSDLKLCAGANMKYAELDRIPKDGSVRCYGYYTKEPDGTVWLYVVYHGRVGFVSKSYLIFKG